VQPRRRWLTARNVLIAYAALVVVSTVRFGLERGFRNLDHHLVPIAFHAVVWGGVWWAAARYNRRHFGPPPPNACPQCKYPLDDAMPRCPECGRPTRPIVVKGFRKG